MNKKMRFRNQLKSFLIFLLLVLKFQNISNYEYDNSYGCSEQNQNQVVPLNNGKYAVIYTCYGVKQYGFGICAHICRESDNGVIFRGIISPNNSNSHKHACSDSLSNGNLVVIYSNFEYNPTILYIFINDSDMKRVYYDSRVTNINNDIQINAKVSSILNKKFVVTWAHNFYDQAGYGIVAKIYFEDGTIYRNEFLVNSFTSNDQNNPNICSMPNGCFVISWDSYNQDGFSNRSIFMQIFDNEGNKIGS